jgi:clan AA aspartic protease (TIGR02281 family)
MALEMGYALSPDLEHVTIGTANGTILAPVVLLESVNLHGYAVRNIKAIVLPAKSSARIGLLGLNFLDHFRYSVDAGRREFRLERR